MSTALAFNDRKVGAACTRFEVRQDFSYDPLAGRLSSEDTTLRQWNVAQPVQKWSQSYLYDGAGRITQVTYPYCLLNCAAAPRTVTTTYDQGRPVAVSGFASAITYHDNGTLNTVRHANNVLFTSQADPTGIARTAALQADLGANKLWPREDYVYDGAGNIQKIGAKSFIYDLSSRLSSALVPSAGALPYQAYTYDAFNNLTRIARGASATNISTYVDYGAAPATNRLQGASYDGSGNLLAYQGSSYSWDRLQHLSTVTTGSETWVHTYNASGERVWSWRTAPSRLDTYAVPSADGKVLTDFTQVGSTYTWEDYVYREGQLLGAALSDGSVRHFDVDHLGSVRLETSAAGAVTYRDFWPSGEEATPPSGTEQMKFTGHERDLGDPSSTADDLDYMHARYYKPLFGRMISADPHRGDLKEPKTWNRYAYVGCNPVLYSDPTGEYMCAAKPEQCTAFEKARQDSLQSAQASQDLKNAAGVYGAPGTDNGITVAFGDPGDDAAASTESKPKFDVVGEKAVAVSTKSDVTVKTGLSGIELQAAVAHEGSHILDAQAFIKSFDGTGEHQNDSLNLTRQQSDEKAYRISAEVVSITGGTLRLDGGTLKPHMKPRELDKEIKGIISRLSAEYRDKKIVAWP